MSALGSPRLVFGDDGSPGADVAWLWINEHRWLGWRLEVVTATGVALGEPHSWTEPVPCRRPFAEAGFDSHLSRRPEQDPRLALCADGELLVVGGRGRGLLKALHLGSTTEWLAVRPPMPMIIARHGRPTRSVVLATDGSADARAATEALAMLPLADSLRLTVVVVDDGTIAEVDPVIDEAVAAFRGSGRDGRADGPSWIGAGRVVPPRRVDERRPRRVRHAWPLQPRTRAPRHDSPAACAQPRRVGAPDSSTHRTTRRLTGRRHGRPQALITRSRWTPNASTPNLPPPQAQDRPPRSSTTTGS